MTKKQSNTEIIAQEIYEGTLIAVNNGKFL